MRTPPPWGIRHVGERALELGAIAVWGARVIARGFDLPADRQGWDSTATDADRRQLSDWINNPAPAFNDVEIDSEHQRVGVPPFDLARLAAARMYEDEILCVYAWTGPVRCGDEMRSLRFEMVARKAGGYVYLTAATLQPETTLGYRCRGAS